MSLISWIKNAKLRDHFKVVAPEPSMFTVDPESAFPQIAAFGRCPAIVAGDPVEGGRAGRVGTAFDYLFRAQIAAWVREPPDLSMKWQATRGLSYVNFPSDGVPFDLADSVHLGPICLDFLADARCDSPVAPIFRAYDAACRRWSAFVVGDEREADLLVDSVWLLAGLEATARGNPYAALDAETIADPPDDISRSSILAMWREMQKRGAMFASDSRVYNPEFGAASQLVGGADADIVLDDTLIEIKTTGNPGYRWDYAAQLASYVVLAAMHGGPWPLHRAGIYQARFGRLLWLNVAEFAATNDLVGFAERLTARGRRDARGDREAMIENLRSNLKLL